MGDQIEFLPTWNKIADNHGGMYTLKKFAGLINVNSGDFLRMIRSGVFDDFILHKGKDFIIGTEDEVKSNTKVGLPGSAIAPIKQLFSEWGNTLQEFRDDGSFIEDYKFANFLGLTTDQLFSELESGKWWDESDFTTAFNPAAKRYVYFFNTGALKKYPYRNIRQLAREYNVNPETAYGWKRNGMLPMVDERRVDIRAFDKTHILEMNDQKQINPRNSRYYSEVTPWDLLTENWKRTISEYLTIRRRGVRVAEYSPYKKKLTTRGIENHRNHLSRFFIITAAYESHIDNIFRDDHRRLKDFNESEVQLMEGWLLSHSLSDITRHDVSFFLDGIAQSTQFDLKFYLEPIFLWHLDVLNDDLDEDDNEAVRQYSKVRKRLRAALKQFPAVDAPENLHPEEMTEWQKKMQRGKKVYLSRFEALQVYQFIRISPISNPKWKKIRNSLAWVCCLFMGIRPEEVIRIEINEFMLDEHGFLKTDDSGYGLLDLPAWKSKGEYGPSHPNLKILVVPELVKCINEFLKMMYTKEPGIPTGKGLLFRRELFKWEYKDKMKNPFRFLDDLREKMDFFEPEVRHSLVLKTTRHSMNNWIRKIRWIDDDLTLWHVVRASQVQMRHDIKKKGFRDIGESNYTEEIDADEYFRIVDAALNFPWDFDELKLWEARTQKHITIKTNSNEIYQLNGLDREKVLEELRAAQVEYDTLLDLYNQYTGKKREKALLLNGYTMSSATAKLASLEGTIKQLQELLK